MLVGNCAKRDFKLNVANVVLRSGTILMGAVAYTALESIPRYRRLNGAIL